MAQVGVGLHKEFINNFVFPTLVRAAGFNNNHRKGSFPADPNIACCVGLGSGDTSYIVTPE